MKPVTKTLDIGGMTCINCQNRIERKLRNTAGVERAKVSYSAGTAVVTFDSDIVSLEKITTTIEKLNYKVLEDNKPEKTGFGRVTGILAIILSLYVILQKTGVMNKLVPSQLAKTGMGYGMLFVIGLITSLHCIAMCGGIGFSQSLPRGTENDYNTLDSKAQRATKNNRRFSSFVPTVLYNLGRVISYTAIGIVLGFASMFLGGQESVGVPVFVQGVLKLVAGVFMVVMGMNMLGIFPWLRKLQPHMPKFLARKAGEGQSASKSPLIVGLLNGFMPCGPLQSMWLVALGAGANTGAWAPLVGGLSMFLFSLGTVPLMLGLGSVVSALGKKFTKKVTAIGAVLVVTLGLAMLSQGGSLSGLLQPELLLAMIIVLSVLGVVSAIPFRTPSGKAITVVATLGVAVLVLLIWNPASKNPPIGNVQIIDGKQVITSELSSGRYPNITVQAGTPVKWVITAPQGSINGCNNRMLLQEYGIEYSFKTGENVIEFTPEKAGTFQYSCWMGMIRGKISVTGLGEAGNTDSADAEQDVPAAIGCLCCQ
ncbi:MAG: sulfite exporter TauE/SafE family protein [Oscillospiraceae bacterium]|nr:sulfite exporter TauE/SafE family protein [Oscillospiraceae bacterium]